MRARRILRRAIWSVGVGTVTTARTGVWDGGVAAMVAGCGRCGAMHASLEEIIAWQDPGDVA